MKMLECHTKLESRSAFAYNISVEPIKPTCISLDLSSNIWRNSSYSGIKERMQLLICCVYIKVSHNHNRHSAHKPPCHSSTMRATLYYDVRVYGGTLRCTHRLIHACTRQEQRCARSSDMHEWMCCCCPTDPAHTSTALVWRCPGYALFVFCDTTVSCMHACMCTPARLSISRYMG